MGCAHDVYRRSVGGGLLAKLQVMVKRITGLLNTSLKKPGCQYVRERWGQIGAIVFEQVAGLDLLASTC